MARAVGVLLPLRGPLAGPAGQVLEAIRLEVERRGDDVELVVRDHGVDGGDWPLDDRQAAGDARALAQDDRVLAVLGPFNSGAAVSALRPLNEAGLALVSPVNTYIGLTVGFHDDEPGRYTAGGRPTFLRVFPNDLHQGAAIVQHARELGARSLFALLDGEIYGRSIAAGVTRAAPAAGVAVTGLEAWDPEAGDHVALLERVVASGAEAVVLAGVLEDDGAGLLRDAATVMASRRLPILAGDGFLISDRLAAVGPAVEGLLLFAPGVRPGALPAAGEALAAELGARLGVDAGAVSEFALHAAVAAGLVLDALRAAGGASGPTEARAAVLDALFAARVEDGPLGAFTFGPQGDVRPEPGAVVVGFTVLRAGPDGTTERTATVIPAPELVHAAMTDPG
jgi:branched-chain amino acid transport system substrate-binding protein